MPRRKRKKKVRLQRIVFTILIIVIIVSASWMIYQWSQYRKVQFTRYPEFGIAIPESYSIHGIDVSRYQESIAWEEVQSMKVKNIQLGFAFIKATEGIGNTDPQFGRNWKRAKKSGMVRGAYHFFMANKDGKMQAENFIKKVELEPGDLPPVLDIEQLYGATNTQLKREIKIWLAVVENYYHVKPIIYTNVGFYNRCLGSEFDQFPLWVAHYYQLQEPRISRGWSFWQHNDEGKVNGIISKVDFNVFSGDSAAFKDILIH
ncbi:MAG: glycoside hydrolase family 25 protein [Bacteroidia bacterium]|nr:glycoside hydrolase family 25 protein [Bacteroidia bacterium]